MNTFLKKAALAAALATASLSAHAAEAEIAVWADVDPTLALLKADGRPLDSSVKLGHNPANGKLTKWSETVRIYSNATDKDIEVRLGFSPSLSLVGGGGTPVPLKVSLNKQVLATTAITFDADAIFDGATPGASLPMDLEIEQGNDVAIDKEGRYEGIVRIAMVQAAGTP
ncbi:fimbrial protein [Stenotrophomonas cyclobalanopsidis]|uniref:Fimbrial protein n=1 Tax=Stenotrophomonas cyclobalanopsidis TaxID=2771362 RepID=A0ABQ6T1C3_9GAMM|nr:CS1 type fimbrial major subunit [Stenotrophomonas cyclobalanopsidis]KAA8999190.1 fimbrial protein [Stenotrophomonas cyclobalanopsidis]